jgi:hypothetical protein
MISTNLNELRKLIPSQVTLVAVSKTKPVEMVQEAYACGIHDFGENYVQELCDKQEQLPADIRWHFIGHLQSNKVKYIAPFVYLIHGVDSEKLLIEIDKQAKKTNRIVQCLLQVHVASEETKFGWDDEELRAFLTEEKMKQWPNLRICGLMGMASFTDDEQKVRGEFKQLKTCFDFLKANAFANAPHFSILSMGMSADWKMAVEEGSTMIRIGSTIFGSRS